MNKLDNDCFSYIFKFFINKSFFNPVLKLVNLKFKFLYEKSFICLQKNWEKKNLYLPYLDNVKNNWVLFKKEWDMKYCIYNKNFEKTYNHDRILNNYCTFYLLQNLILDHFYLLKDYYNAFPRLYKIKKKMIDFLVDEMELKLINNIFSNYILISPSFNNYLFDIESSKQIKDTYYSIILGTPNTIYENGIFILKIIFFRNNLKPPIINFLNKIYHPNVDIESGKININILNEEWQPIYSFNPFLLIISIQSLFDEPELSNYNPKIYNKNYNTINQYINDYDLFKVKAKKYVDLYANLNIEDILNFLYNKN